MSDPSNSPINGFLIRLPAAASGALAASGDALKAAGNQFEFEPLFSTSSSTLGLAAADGKDWILARPKKSFGGGNPWDMVHEAREMMAGGLGLASDATPDLIEPDLVQDWLPMIPGQPATLAAAGEACAFEDQNLELPTRPGQFAWHLGDRFSQLAGARNLVGSPQAIVRVAHLDTGYDPDHQTLQTDLVEKGLQRNFIDGSPSDDARDPGNTGPLRNPGHGTATLALLAGGHLR
ncbi:S8/S53 family peptidase, partial [Stieleria sp.]|uniref:S8/S53 family peptidase n=1 Tax=Stieleria sp. TaxID=2795976 RepID=UPI0035675379